MSENSASQAVDALEIKLGGLAARFRKNAVAQNAVVTEYAETVRKLLQFSEWCGEPDVDSQLPDKFMPQVYKDYWSLRHGLAFLDELAKDNYGKSLQSVLADRNYDSKTHPDLPYKRIGHLMAVWAKKPFSEPDPYDPLRENNWADSKLSWKFRQPSGNQITEHNRIQSKLLVRVAATWDRPVEVLHEYNIFHWLCEKLQPVVCEDSKALEQADKVAQELRKQGGDVTTLSSKSILAATSVGVANLLVESAPWLSSHSAIVTGYTVLAVWLGKEKLCNFIRGFLENEPTKYKPEKDSEKGRYPKCDSTKDGKRCSMRVPDQGDKCWIHGGIANDLTVSIDVR